MGAFYGRSVIRTITMTHAGCEMGTSSGCVRVHYPRNGFLTFKSGLPGSEVEGVMYADYLVEMTIAGQVVWERPTWDRSPGA
jgi:hypothetical protein